MSWVRSALEQVARIWYVYASCGDWWRNHCSNRIDITFDPIIPILEFWMDYQSHRYCPRNFTNSIRIKANTLYSNIPRYYWYIFNNIFSFNWRDYRFSRSTYWSFYLNLKNYFLFFFLIFIKIYTNLNTKKEVKKIFRLF